MTGLSKAQFIHVLSLLVVVIAATGGFYVLTHDGFSAELKGSVVTIMLLGGFTSVMQYWLNKKDPAEPTGDKA